MGRLPSSSNALARQSLRFEKKGKTPRCSALPLPLHQPENFKFGSTKADIENLTRTSAKASVEYKIEWEKRRQQTAQLEVNALL